MRLTSIFAALLGAVALTVAAPAAAQLALHVPYAAGSPSHAMAQRIARALETSLQQPVTLVTGTAIDAAHAVARVQPHGTAILFGDLETNLKLRDAQAGLGLPGDFDSIGAIGMRRFGLYANPGAPPIRAAVDLFDAINRNELGMLVHGDASSRLCANALSQLLRLPPERVVGFPGIGPAFAQVMGSGSSFICLPAGPAVPSGLRLIALSRPGHFQVPSMQSLGIEFTTAAAVGLFVRKDTSVAVRVPLENAVNSALENDGLRTWMRDNFAMDVRQPGAAPASTNAVAAPTHRTPAPASVAPAAAPTPDVLPRTRLTLNDATAECDCTRKLGRCAARTSIRATQTTRLSNGLSSLVIVGIDPPPKQCVEVTVYLRERAVIGDRPRSTGHPLYRVIDGPTDVEWRNVGTPASELSYSITPSETECYLCSKKKSVTEPATAPAVGSAAGSGFYFHASIMSPTQHQGTYPGGETYFRGSHLAIGLSPTSA